jgi:predicted AlkP superfamily phosphohydrolase/phosphomutase
MSQKVLIIGLDGGSFNILKPWMDAGYLPTLKKITHEGVSGILQSSIAPTTVVAWTSFMTGKNPGKHGAYEFFVKRKGSYDEVPVTALSLHEKAFWDILSDQGKRVMILNLPVLYPPRPVNGVAIAGLAPSGKKDFIYPPSLVDEIEETFGPYPLYMKTPVSAVSLLDKSIIRFLNECNQNVAYKCAVAEYLLEKQPCDLLFLHLWETDRVQHELYDLLDPRHPRHHRERAERHQSKIIDFYKNVDAHIEQLWQKMGQDTCLFVVSDHGFAPMYRHFDLQVWLLQEGYLRLKRRPLSLLKTLAWKAGMNHESLYRHLYQRLLRLRADADAKNPMDYLKYAHLEQKLFLSNHDIDWSRTRAFCKFGMGQIIINLKGREPLGIVEPGREYEELRKEIAEKLRTLCDPETGQEVNGRVFFREDIYHGPYFDEAPDLTFITGDSNYYTSKLGAFSSNKLFCNNMMMPGNHTLWGIFTAHGGPIRKGSEIKGARIIDVAPTVLYLLGFEIPQDMDGKVLTDIFVQEFLDQRPPKISDEVTETKKRGQDLILDEKETADIVERLRDLGYIT